MPEKIDCRVRFVTPAFLGNAEQQGQWRTPPFKALLREWWRVAAAPEHGFGHERLRESEGLLFGHAWLQEPGNRNKTWAMQGQVRLRLDEWRDGQMRAWMGREPRVEHRKVGEQGQNIGAHLYLAYGPLNYQRGRGTTLKNEPAINADDASSLSLGVPFQHQKAMTQVLHLIHWFGTIGGRSRNGWGSVKLEKIDGYTPPAMNDLLSGATLSQMASMTRPLHDCLLLDWPHALGTDNHGVLLWKSRQDYPDWSSAMQELARVKIAFRTALNVPVGQVGDRHILAYPVTHHRVNAWLENGRDVNRLANQLRFKVVQDNNSRYWCLACHLPCGLPEMLQQKLGPNRIDPDRQIRVWQTVHAKLNVEMRRIAQGGQQ